MGARRLDGLGVGTGQIDRHDFEGLEHLERLIPGRKLDIEQGSVKEPRDHTSDPTGTSHWTHQESLLTQQGGVRSKVENGWKKLSGDRGGGRNLGHVAIDHPNVTVVDPPRTFTPDQLKNGMWVVKAAEFEEDQRQTRGRYGAGHELSLPSIEVDGDVPGPGGEARRSKNRRRFRVG